MYLFPTSGSTLTDLFPVVYSYLPELLSYYNGSKVPSQTVAGVWKLGVLHE